MKDDPKPMFALIEAASHKVTLIASRIVPDGAAWLAGELRILSPAVNEAFVLQVDASVSVGMEVETDGTVRQAAQVTPTVEAYTAALEAMYDAKAHERRYDNRYTCAVRAGYAGPFQAEAQAFALWMDNCNALAYQVMEQVQGGKLAAPTIEGLLAMMPGLAWPARKLE